MVLAGNLGLPSAPADHLPRYTALLQGIIISIPELSTGPNICLALDIQQVDAEVCAHGCQNSVKLPLGMFNGVIPLAWRLSAAPVLASLLNFRGTLANADHQFVAVLNGSVGGVTFAAVTPSGAP